ncbi:hypothetical protein ACE1TH_18480 [Shouchella sp. JSM 1781072]|uniref:hypothetical protein n=1 Tax=Bacillaceae TaxID=186817 RepID=UPI00159BEA8C|nr:MULTISPECIES: hypothetical protein [Bacillaceae]UTR07620.1 hypothetical protein MM326_06205 [Alkalihalobacillus sp. LMS6]
MYAVTRIVDGHTQSLKNTSTPFDKLFSSYEHADLFASKLNSNTFPEMHWHVNKVYRS